MSERRLGVEMKVPKNDVWSRKKDVANQVLSCRKGSGKRRFGYRDGTKKLEVLDGVPESKAWVKEWLLEWNRKAIFGVPGWYLKAIAGVPGWYLKAMGVGKRDLECWKGSGKRRLG